MIINIPTSQQKRLVIIGGGFAGLTLAQKLAKSDLQIVLLDKNNYHQFQPLFYQVAMAGLEPSSISFPLRKTFQNSKNVFIRVTEVEEVDTQKNEIHTSIGSLAYDYLVLAIGADTNFFGNERLAEKTIPMKSVSEALFLRNAILEDYEKALSTANYDDRQGLIDIVIVGGGPTGVEVAGALAEMKKYVLPKDYRELDCDEVDIHLLQGSDCLLKGMSSEASESAYKFLTDLGVDVKLNVRVTDYDGEYVHTKDGTKIRADKVIWAAGITGNKIKGLPKESMTWGNRILVNRFNQIKGFENIYAIGDIAFMTEEAYPQGHPQVAQVAIQQAKKLGKNLPKIIQDKTPKPFSYNDLGSMATIGRHRAVVDLPKWKFQGFFAWMIWLGVHLFQLIGVKNRLFVFINWLWNYLTYDQSLRLIIRPKVKKETSLENSKAQN
ncbi:MAG: NAD(P)/FAD-dependent oxidoreductase [Bacteroidetes bacterium]|jgi:NADH dehydrogenase|nr:NAD(P)/FAD-dependent oxidoreductase [Bacteroidota bacterium]